MGFLDFLLGREAIPATTQFTDVQLAAAALMVEAARQDGNLEARERLLIEQLVRERFSLGAAASQELLEEAEQAAAGSTGWQGFTNKIKEAFDQDGRIAIVEMLWEVILADGRIDDMEASLMRVVTGLLYISGRDSAEARARAQGRVDAARAAGPWRAAPEPQAG